METPDKIFPRNPLPDCPILGYADWYDGVRSGSKPTLIHNLEIFTRESSSCRVSEPIGTAFDSVTTTVLSYG